jgi:DNA polymerase-3 subunit delta'
MVIIDPADRLYREGAAAHTILKTLEEPPGHTVFCLVTAAPESLLETIRSRCRRIDVHPVPRAEIETGLIARGVEPGLAARCAEAARGRPGRAIQFAAQPDLMGDRARLLERCARVAGEGTGDRFRYANDLAERWRKDRAAVLNEIDVWEAFWEERLRDGASEGASPEALRGALEALRAITRVREDLTVNVIPRTAFELMLLSFPRVTLSISREEEPAAYA